MIIKDKWLEEGIEFEDCIYELKDPTWMRLLKYHEELFILTLKQNSQMSRVESHYATEMYEGLGQSL